MKYLIATVLGFLCFVSALGGPAGIIPALIFGGLAWYIAEGKKN